MPQAYHPRNRSPAAGHKLHPAIGGGGKQHWMTGSAQRVRGLLAAVAMVCAWVSIGAGDQARQAPAQRVVFSSERDGNIDLFIAARDGSGLRRLTTDAAADELPRCSPDGRELLFRRGGSARGELMHLDLDSLAERQLTRDEVRDSNPQWSLDARAIFATRRIDGFDRIVRLDRDGRDLRVLSPDRDWHDVMPALSPDGRSLVFHTYRYGKEADLQLLEVVGSTSRRITDAAGNDYEASFAGDDAVVFSSNRGGGHYRIYTQPLEAGSAARLLADTGADAWGPRYSEASREVLFYTGQPGAWRMMTVSIAGGPARPLLDDSSSRSTADWCSGRS
jgi:Tol biopolymer transport system component